MDIEIKEVEDKLKKKVKASNQYFLFLFFLPNFNFYIIR